MVEAVGLRHVRSNLCYYFFSKTLNVVGAGEGDQSGEVWRSAGVL